MYEIQDANSEIEQLKEKLAKKNLRIAHLEEDRDKLRNKVYILENSGIRRKTINFIRRKFGRKTQEENIEGHVKKEDLNKQETGKINKKNFLQEMPPCQEGPETILFMCTNGAGLGHLTRSLAIAKRIQKIDSKKQIVFLTTSIAISTVSAQGFQAFHIPPRNLLNNIDASQWGGLLKRQLIELFALYNIKTVVFDGAFPYAQFIQTVSSYEGVTKVWVKRGGEKAGTEDERKKKEELFDYLIIPGESGADLPADDEKHYFVNPIVYIDDDELLDKESVRKLFKVPEKSKLVYVQLGAGNINDIESDLGKVLSMLKQHEDIMVVLGESIISLKSMNVFDEQIYIIKDYPNSKYFKGFDFVISACGYNSYQELSYIGVPTIYLPNMECKTDDQYGRAIKAEKAGAAIVLTELDDNAMANAIELMLNCETNQKMKEAAEKLKVENGAERAAQILSDMKINDIDLL